jgi:hypothetical protein
MQSYELELMWLGRRVRAAWELPANPDGPHRTTKSERRAAKRVELLRRRSAIQICAAMGLPRRVVLGGDNRVRINECARRCRGTRQRMETMLRPHRGDAEGAQDTMASFCQAASGASPTAPTPSLTATPAESAP